MKMKIEIEESLLREAREPANHEGVTIREIVERSLRLVLAESRLGPSFKLRRASFKGNGLQPALREATWEDLRDLSYGDRGTKRQPRDKRRG
jgi:hypothetical protein